MIRKVLSSFYYQRLSILVYFAKWYWSNIKNVWESYLLDIIERTTIIAKWVKYNYMSIKLYFPLNASQQRMDTIAHLSSQAWIRNHNAMELACILLHKFSDDRFFVITVFLGLVKCYKYTKALGNYEWNVTVNTLLQHHKFEGSSRLI